VNSITYITETPTHTHTHTSQNKTTTVQDAHQMK